MPCLLILIALMAPRVALVLAWLFTDWIERAYDGVLVPLLGLVFLPLTTLAYALVWSPDGQVEGWDWFWIGMAVLIDLGPGGAARRR
jgi:hypothetical protein